MLFLLAVVVGGAVGYYGLGRGHWTFFDCLYMTVITVTTVGFGETLDGMDKVEYARAFTMVLLLFGTGSIVFFASTITAFIVQVSLGDLPHGSIGYQSIFAAGLVLMLMTLVFNVIGFFLTRRFREAY